ncbi:unnamed protein product [Rotaria sp. Silwood2]|nr:unnamed protein product [Rotaria sp. Silwood2]CAF2529007.1 unnamed protein product [Rotaria sp. Silwood2]CAF2931946.1 unnamed protein product [Rotaria sp. Silwood2]CAF3903384.1 unnamed protein product [Rotaria sp. Silwood2]CAF4142759.1 unnamed protein product [Rotaria sp. Silwood2]
MAVADLDLPVAHYDLFAHEAHRLIDQLVNQSLAHVNDTKKTFDETNEEYNIQRDRFVILENEAKTKGQTSVRWPSIAEFTNAKIGVEKINEYIEKEWKTSPGGYDSSWLYAIDFVEQKSLEFNDLYIYRVCYSIPTRRQPIPRQTVSIYFTIDVSKVKPKNTTVQVSFVFETMRIVYHPGEFRFRQNWLQDIVLLKEKMIKNIDF